MTGLAIFGLIALIPIAIILRGFVMTQLWHWFIVPVFSIGELSIPYAIGFSIIVSLFTTDLKRDDSTATDSATIIGTAIGGPLFLLLFGWIVGLFI